MYAQMRAERLAHAAFDPLVNCSTFGQTSSSYAGPVIVAASR